MTINTMAGSCVDLESVNLNYTSATPASVATLLRTCGNIRILKIAGIPNWVSRTL
jgi:hypothetical protein